MDRLSSGPLPMPCLLPHRRLAPLLLRRDVSIQLGYCDLSEPAGASADSSIESFIKGLPEAAHPRLGVNKTEECTQVGLGLGPPKEPEPEPELDALWDSLINYGPSTSQAPTGSRDILRYKLVSSSSILPALAVKPLPKNVRLSGVSWYLPLHEAGQNLGRSNGSRVRLLGRPSLRNQILFPSELPR